MGWFLVRCIFISQYASTHAPCPATSSTEENTESEGMDLSYFTSVNPSSTKTREAITTKTEYFKIAPAGWLQLHPSFGPELVALPAFLLPWQALRTRQILHIQLSVGGIVLILFFFFFFPSCNAWTAWLWMITDEYGVVASDKPSPNAWISNSINTLAIVFSRD